VDRLFVQQRRLGRVFGFDPLGDLLVVIDVHVQFVLCLFRAPDGFNGVVIRLRHATVSPLEIIDCLMQIRA